MLEISGSYVFTTIVLGVVVYVLKKANNAEDATAAAATHEALRESITANDKEIAVMKTQIAAQDGDVKEIKQDVKRILERLPKEA
jgi:hypothetical protein